MLSFETSLRLKTSLKYDVPMVTKTIYLLYDIIEYRNYSKSLKKVLKTHISTLYSKCGYNLQSGTRKNFLNFILIKLHKMGPQGPNQFYHKNIHKSALMQPTNKNIV